MNFEVSHTKIYMCKFRTHTCIVRKSFQRCLRTNNQVQYLLRLLNCKTNENK